ncbi:hypothetical protein SALB_02443 [Streptomyces noursei]|uniref:Uncharacterized protein n=1 Tax=Streptomyces noursei TaxID=1971 RepID=A0A401QWI9_STRNR|nr:hypothetical protein SALB_02443 [Streptomyces noursei]
MDGYRPATGSHSTPLNTHPSHQTPPDPQVSPQPVEGARGVDGDHGTQGTRQGQLPPAAGTAPSDPSPERSPEPSAHPRPLPTPRKDDPSTAPSTADDLLFGDVHVTLDADRGVVTVTGDALPTVSLVRAEGADVDEAVPLGTRSAAALTLTVDGEAARLAPARGRFLRRSYRVDVECTGVRYRLTPDGLEESTLFKEGIAIGELSSTGDGRVSATWPEDRPAGSEVLPQDAAVGYALAAAFGTGGQSFWVAAGAFVGDLLS